MRALFVVLALVACTPAPEEKSADTTQDLAATTQAAPTGAPMSTGLLGGMSTTAAGDVAAVTLNRENLAFSNSDGEETFTIATAFLGEVAPATPIAAGGDSFAAAAPSSTATRVEVRRIGKPLRVDDGNPCCTRARRAADGSASDGVRWRRHAGA